MGKLINLLEKNYKTITIILFTIGVLFLIKLWMFGLKISGSSSGGFIDLSLFYDFEYFWTNAGYISVVSLIISVFLYFKIQKTDNRLLKVKIALVVFIIGLVSKPLFFEFSPDYKFYFTPVTKQYKDKDGNVTDVDKYLESVGKYCDYRIAGSLGYMEARSDMCSMNNKYQTFFRTADEYIKVLEYAKDHDNKLLYERTYGGVNKFGVEKILEKYDDVTFQAYVLWNEWSDDKLRSLINKKTNSLLNLISFIDQSLLNSKESNYGEFSNEKDYWENVNIQIKEQLSKIPEVNYRIF